MAILTRRMLYRRLLKRGRLAEIVPIKAHRKFQPTEILVIGIDSAGDIQVQASPPDPGNSMWLMASATKKLLGG